MVRSPDRDTIFFDIKAGVLQGDTLAPYIFIICLDYVLRNSADSNKELGFTLSKARSKRYPAETITDVDYADDIALMSDNIQDATYLLHNIENTAKEIGLYINAKKTEFISYNHQGTIQTVEGENIKSVLDFTYLGSNIASTEKDINIRIKKAWGAINSLNTIWKSTLTQKLKRDFFRAVVESVLTYGATTWTLTKKMESKLDGTYTRMLRAALNIPWQIHPTKKQLYGHLPPITVSIRERRLRFVGHCWRSKEEVVSKVLLWKPKHGTTSSGRPTRTYIDQLADDTGCLPEELATAMLDRDGWKKRVLNRASSTG